MTYRCPDRIGGQTDGRQSTVVVGIPDEIHVLPHECFPRVRLHFLATRAEIEQLSEGQTELDCQRLGDISDWTRVDRRVVLEQITNQTLLEGQPFGFRRRDGRRGIGCRRRIWPVLFQRLILVVVRVHTEEIYSTNEREWETLAPG